jgi:hypothetical protein
MLISRRRYDRTPLFPVKGSASYSLPREPLSNGEIHNPGRMRSTSETLEKAMLGRLHPILTAPGSMIPGVTVFGAPDPVAVSGRGNLERDDPAQRKRLRPISRSARTIPGRTLTHLHRQNVSQIPRRRCPS